MKIAKDKSKVKKNITTLIALVIIAGGIFIGYKFFTQKIFTQKNNNKERDKVLEVVRDVHFNENENKWFWKVVDNATAYVADINGEQQTVDQNYLYYIPTTATTEFKVKAIDSTGEYASSSWSDVYTYTLSNEFSYSKVAAYLNECTPNRPLQKVVSAYVKNNKLYANCYCKEGSKDKLIKLRVTYNESVNSISDCISTKNYSLANVFKTFDAVNYDSASYLIKADAFAEKMAEHGLSGYDFSVVSSQAAKVNNSKDFHVFATYKATNGSEVKYVQSDLLCGIANTSAQEQLNFTTKMLDAGNLYLDEKSFVELKGDEIDFAKTMEGLGLNNHVSTQNNFNYDFDYGMGMN